MKRHKIGAFPRLEHYGAEAERLGAVYLAARVEREEAEADDRRLALDGGKTAEAADRALADEALAAGKKMPGTPNAEAYKAEVIRAGARLRAAQVAERAADEAVYEALTAGRDLALTNAEQALAEAADNHRKAIAAVTQSRAQLLAAEAERRYIDGLDEAVDFLARHPAGIQWSFVFPVRPTQRPAQRIGDRFIHHGNGHVLDIDKGIAAMRNEIELVHIRRYEGPAVAFEDTPRSERQFNTGTAKW